MSADADRIAQMDLMGGQDDAVIPGVELDENLNANVEWVGLPEFRPAGESKVALVLSFDSDEERDQLISQLSLVIAKKTRGTWSAWWPPREKEDLASLRFDFGGGA